MDDLKVRNEFDRRATLHGDLNAVLDAGAGLAVVRANRWRDYVSRRVARRYLRPNRSDIVLDFGCGVGRLSFYLSPLVKRVIAVDASPGMIAVAKRQMEAGGWTNLSFHCAEPGVWPVEDGSVTKALCFWTLAHVSDNALPQVLKQLHGALATGGRVVCFEQVRAQEREDGEIHLQRSVSTYLGFFEQAGLRLLEQRFVLRYPSYAMALWNRWPWLPTIAFPFLAAVERFTVNRQPETAEYHTSLFALERRE
jgi:SAM-dependent methyltransferase